MTDDGEGPRMNADERRLLEELRRRAGEDPAATPRDAAAGAGVSTKWCVTFCKGWWGRRWLERAPGVGRDEGFLSGRLTAAGMTADLDGR